MLLRTDVDNRADKNPVIGPGRRMPPKKRVAHDSSIIGL